MGIVQRGGAVPWSPFPSMPTYVVLLAEEWQGREEEV
jgi:hypothetical protein